jgi:NDP-sugar pyrophosphorylase family protein
MEISVQTKAILDLSKTIAADLFKDILYPWEILPRINLFILSFAQNLPKDYIAYREDVWVAKTVKIAERAQIFGPAILCENAEIRPGALIRGNVIVGANVVVGNSTELKNSILFDSVQVPHYNYIGDSVLGYKVHFGAGAITSNVKADKSDIVVHIGSGLKTGLKKFGAIVGDYAEIGCNSVLNPGTVIGRCSTVYPISSIRGIVPEGHIYKGSSCLVPKEGYV